MTSGIKTCSVEECNGKSRSRGWCKSHYEKWRRHGDPEWEPEEDATYRSILAAEPTDSCVIWPHSMTADGYGRRQRKEYGTYRVSRQIAHDTHGSPPEGKPNALHSCGRGQFGCVNPLHLRWGSQRENMADRIIHGTSNRGQRHGLSKLTEEDVLAISGSDETCSALSERFNVCRKTISLIRRGESWAWLTGRDKVPVGTKVLIQQ